MKKIFKTLFSLLVVLGLVSVAVACDEPTPEPTEEVTPTPTPQPQEPAKTYHVVGGYLDDWNTYSDANKMTEITVDALPADIKSQVDTTREITALMKLEGRVFNVGPAWTANANIDGEVVVLNGGYTVKVVRAGYDAEDDVSFADQWNPDPKTSCVANLTPDTLYMPKWVETPAEGEEGLGTWADNPVVIGGAGEYTVYFIEYAGANTAEAPKYAMALVLTKELEEPKTTAELIAEELNYDIMEVMGYISVLSDKGLITLDIDKSNGIFEEKISLNNFYEKISLSLINELVEEEVHHNIHKRRRNKP